MQQYLDVASNSNLKFMQLKIFPFLKMSNLGVGVGVKKAAPAKRARVRVRVAGLLDNGRRNS